MSLLSLTVADYYFISSALAGLSEFLANQPNGKVASERVKVLRQHFKERGDWLAKVSGKVPIPK